MTKREQFLVDALKRAERDFEAIKNDDRGKIDPAFALIRVRAALDAYKSMEAA